MRLIRRFVAAAAAVVCLSASAPAVAAPEPAPAAAPSDDARAFEAWMPEYGRWIDALSQVASAARGEIHQLLAAGEVARSYDARNDRRGGRLWLRTLAAEREKAAEDLLARLDALGPAPRPAVTDGTSTAVIDAADRIPGDIRTMILSLRDVRTAHLTALDVVARGEDPNGEVLARAESALRTQLLNSTRIFLDLSAETQPTDQPSHHALRALSSLFSAWIVTAEAAAAEEFGASWDAAATARALERHAQDIDRALLNQASALRGTRAALDTGEITPAARRKIDAILATWDETATALRGLARILREQAGVLRETGSVAAARAHQRDAVQAFADTLDALDARRLAILSEE